MSHLHLDETRLNDAADGTLAGTDAAAVQEHLDGCAECADRVQEIRALSSDARRLGGDIEPERDLWPGIVARMRSEGGREIAFPGAAGAAGAAGGERDRVIRPYDRAARHPAMRVAAAVTLLLVGAAAGVLVTRAADAPAGAPPVATTSDTPPDRAGVALVGTDVRATVQREYASPVAELEAELAERRDQLSPEAIAEIERNLRIIDEAIDAAVKAFDESPGDPVLPDMLHKAYGRKVELLEQAVGLPRII